MDPRSSKELHALTSWQHMTRTIAHYELVEQIGEGTYGKVYKAVCKDTQKTVALKKMRIHNIHYFGMPLQFLREIKILKRLQHVNLLSMIEVVTSKGVEHLDVDDDDDNNNNNDTDNNDTDSKKRNGGKSRGTTTGTSKSKALSPSSTAKGTTSKDNKSFDAAREGYKGNLFLVLEYVSHDLTGLMDVSYPFTQVHIKVIMRQLLEALSYMHEQKYVHRDIKSSNILIDSHFRLKLADFGLARCIEPAILDQMHDRPSSLDLTNKVITLWYRPPEILVGTTNYGGAVDVWSAGCILAELCLNGKPLFAGKTELEQLSLIIELLGTPSQDTWEYLSNFKRMRSGEMTIDLKKPKASKLRDKYESKMNMATLNLLEKLLEWDPRKRITAASALQQRFFWTQPVAPADPAELGTIQVGPGGDFHEFQTKKKRREAKAIAEKARDDALFKGASDSEAKAEYDKVYKAIMKKVQEEGYDSVKLAGSDVLQKKKKPEKMDRDESRGRHGSRERRSDHDGEDKDEGRRKDRSSSRKVDDRKRDGRNRDRKDSKKRRSNSGDLNGHDQDDEKRRKRRKEERDEKRKHAEGEVRDSTTRERAGGDQDPAAVSRKEITSVDGPGTVDVEGKERSRSRKRSSSPGRSHRDDRRHHRKEHRHGRHRGRDHDGRPRGDRLEKERHGRRDHHHDGSRGGGDGGRREFDDMARRDYPREREGDREASYYGDDPGARRPRGDLDRGRMDRDFRDGPDGRPRDTDRPRDIGRPSDGDRWDQRERYDRYPPGRHGPPPPPRWDRHGEPPPQSSYYGRGPPPPRDQPPPPSYRRDGPYGEGGRDRRDDHRRRRDGGRR